MNAIEIALAIFLACMWTALLVDLVHKLYLNFLPEEEKARRLRVRIATRMHEYPVSLIWYELGRVRDDYYLDSKGRIIG